MRTRAQAKFDEMKDAEGFVTKEQLTGLVPAEEAAPASVEAAAAEGAAAPVAPTAAAEEAAMSTDTLEGGATGEGGATDEMQDGTGTTNPLDERTVEIERATAALDEALGPCKSRRWAKELREHADGQELPDITTIVFDAALILLMEPVASTVTESTLTISKQEWAFARVRPTTEYSKVICDDNFRSRLEKFDKGERHAHLVLPCQASASGPTRAAMQPRRLLTQPRSVLAHRRN